MKILESVQNSFSILGINLNRSTQHHSLKFRRWLVGFVFGTAVTLSYVSIFRAHNFKEYTDSIHMGLALTLGCVLFGIALFESIKISELIGSIETTIIDSE